MQLNRDVDILFQCGDQLCCLIRKQQTSHILDTDGVRTHILDTLCQIYPVFQCICITQCIGHRYLCMTLLLVCSGYCSLKVAHIIHAVEDTDDINTIRNRLLYKILYYVICIRTIAQNVLSTEQHLQLRVLKSIS